MFSVWPSLNKTFDRPLAGCCPLFALWDIIGLTDYRSAVKRRVASDRKNKMIKCHTREQWVVSVIEPVFSLRCVFTWKRVPFDNGSKDVVEDLLKCGKSQQLLLFLCGSLKRNRGLLSRRDRMISCHVSTTSFLFFRCGNFRANIAPSSHYLQRN